MSDSPLAANPYEVLGVTAGASEDELKRAYRARLRQAHPDTGGSADEFQAVQKAWERIGTPAARRAFDSGLDATTMGASASWAPSDPHAAGRAARGTRPAARAQGHPGGWYREQYLDHIREWAGRGVELPDPFDAALVRSAPAHIRHLLANAVAEEQTAAAITSLGIGFTIWHDVQVGQVRGEKLDHIVLGPTGLWALLSEDWGSPVAVKRGEVIGAGLAAGERPLHDLAARARVIARAAKVRFSGLAIVVSDDQAPASLTELSSIRGAQGLLVQRSRLVNVLRSGLPGVGVGGTDLFEVRSRLQGAVRFV